MATLAHDSIQLRIAVMWEHDKRQNNARTQHSHIRTLLHDINDSTARRTGHEDTLREIR